MRSHTVRRGTWCLWALLATASVANAAQRAAPAPRADPFAACRQQFTEKPQDYDSAYCFYTVAQRQGLWEDAERLFEALIREHADNWWLSLAYGHVLRDRQPDAAESSYRRAADGFARQRHAEGEFLARSSLRNFLYPKGRVDEANAQMARIAELAGSIHDPLILAQVQTLQASHTIESGGDLGVAYRLLKGAERTLFPDGPYRLQRVCLTWLGIVAFRLGRHDEAMTLFRALDERARREGDPQTEANAQYNLLNTASLKESLLPTPGARSRLLEIAERTLATGQAVQNQQVALKTRWTLAALLANMEGRRDAALRHLDGCLELATRLHQPQDEVACAWLQASLLASAKPAEARAAQLRALRATERANRPLSDAYSAGRHMQFSWQTKPRAEAIRDSLAAMDAIETLRGLQDDDDSSAALFSTWTLEYYWLSGQLLKDASASDIDLAFSITERMRARSLLDAVGSARERPSPDLPAVGNRRTILQAIAALQRTLMNPTLSDEARRAGLVRLEELEQRERETERQIAVASRRPAAIRPSFATLDALQSALGEHEALLSYQLGIWETYEGEFGGGSWLLAITRHTRSAYRIPDRAHFAPIVPVFTGLLASGDGREGPAAVRLYGDVFGPALDALPSGTKRLIVIPDGPLQQLPLDALRSDIGSPPIASRYEMVVAPSATLWLQWRTGQTPPTSGRVLTFADPVIDGASGADAALRQATLERGLRLGRLPYARRESRAIARHLAGVETLVGEDASEKALKARNLQQYDLVHFAAHAISDEARPERSAVLLAAGDAHEDGLLQSREIQQLDLTGRTVVLSACETASGAVLNGEGVLSLARPFFEAGAHAVVGTRWPIRDQDAAVLFDTFYRHLGEGAAVSEALARAKIDAIAAGRPPAVWAGLILLGDGGASRFTPARSSALSPGRLLPFLVPLAIALLASGVWLVVRRAHAPA